MQVHTQTVRDEQLLHTKAIHFILHPGCVGVQCLRIESSRSLPLRVCLSPWLPSWRWPWPASVRGDAAHRGSELVLLVRDKAGGVL